MVITSPFPKLIKIIQDKEENGVATNNIDFNLAIIFDFNDANQKSIMIPWDL